MYNIETIFSIKLPTSNIKTNNIFKKYPTIKYKTKKKTFI